MGFREWFKGPETPDEAVKDVLEMHRERPAENSAEAVDNVIKLQEDREKETAAKVTNIAEARQRVVEEGKKAEEVRLAQLSEARQRVVDANGSENVDVNEFESKKASNG